MPRFKAPLHASGALLCLAAVLLGTTALWLRFNSPPSAVGARALRTAMQSDLIHQTLPVLESVSARLAAGELPLWNPHACSGIPEFAAIENGVLYPGTWLAIVLPITQATSLLMFIECVLAGWLCALFLRSIGSSTVAASMGGIVFVFTCILGQILWPPIVSVTMWLPWFLLCVEKLIQRPSPWWFCGLSLGAALQLLAGFPQFVFYSYLIVGPWALLRLGEAMASGAMSWQASMRRGALMAGAVFLGVGLAGVQVLPTVEMIGESPRGEMLSPEEIHYLNAGRPRTAVDILRASLVPQPRFISFVLGSYGGYIGVAPLLLLVLAVAAGLRSLRCWFWLLLGAGALVLADGYRGQWAELYDLSRNIPVLGNFRTPERLRLLTFFSAMVLAATGLDLIIQPGSRRRRRALELLTLLASAALAVAMFRMGYGGFAWRIAVAAALIFALIEGAERPPVRQAAGIGLLLLVIFDLTIATGERGTLRKIPLSLSDHYYQGATGSLRPFPSDAFQELRDRSKLQRIELYRFSPRMATSPSNGAYRIACYEPLGPSQWSVLSQLAGGIKVSGMHLYGVDPDEYPTIYDVTSVRRIVVPDERKGYRIVANPDALPRAYLVNRFQVADQQEILRDIARGEPVFHDRVFLEREPELPLAGEAWRRPRPARITAYEPERLEVEIDPPAPSLLVLTDTYYPGWHAKIDGRDAEILRANGLYRAVVVAPGDRRVSFEYRPSSLRRGLLVSGLSLLILVAGSAALHYHARRAA